MSIPPPINRHPHRNGRLIALSLAIVGGSIVTGLQVANADTASDEGVSELAATEDAYLQGSAPFDIDQIRLQHGDRTRVGYVRFDTSGVESAQSVQFDVVVGTDGGAGTMTVSLGGGTDWTADTLTPANAPVAGEQLGAVSGSFSPGQELSFDVPTDIVDGDVVDLVIVHDGSGNDDISLQSTEGGDGPLLVVTSGEGPEPVDPEPVDPEPVGPDPVGPGTRTGDVYSNGFDGLPLGIVDDGQIKESWNSRYAKGPDEGRVSIVTDSRSGRAARVTYPAFGNQSTPSGATWETDIGTSSDELYMSYWVKFDEGFQFVKGGKLPGLAGSTDFPYGDNEFTTRLMWREDGKLEFYLHGFQVDNEEGAEPYRVLWDDFGTHARIEPGQWHHIEIRQKLNTPGLRDGRLQGWLDGVLASDDSSNSGVRAAGQSDTKINHLYFSTFFGGSSAPESQWQPTSDVYATFDDFNVSTDRLGMGDSDG